MYDVFLGLITTLSDLLWGPWTMIFIAFVSVYLTVKARFFQVTHFGYLFRRTFGQMFARSDHPDSGRMTPFQATTTSLAGTVGTVLMAVAVPATAKVVVNESHTEFQIAGNLGSDDGSADGSAWAIQGTNGEAAGFDYNANFDCPAPNGDLASINAHGEATVDTFEVSPTKGKDKFTLGAATGTFMHGSVDSQLCDGTPASVDLAGENFEITMDGTGGSLVRTSGSESWHIPSDHNFHRNDKGLMRIANGIVKIPGLDVFLTDGSIGRHSWSEHTNK